MLTFIFRFLFCSYGNQIRVYSVKTGELVSIFKGHTGEVSDLCLSERNPLLKTTYNEFCLFVLHKPSSNMLRWFLKKRHTKSIKLIYMYVTGPD